MLLTSRLGKARNGGKSASLPLGDKKLCAVCGNRSTLPEFTFSIIIAFTVMQPSAQAG